MRSSTDQPGETRSAGANRGTNQSGVRLYNERLVLSLIRRYGALPKADMARMTGLSPQTISIITNALEADGLLRREEPVRGKVGQPLVPYSLAAEGAYSLGLKIGRRSADLYLIDFRGGVVASLHETYPYPTPDGIRRFTGRGIDTLVANLGETQKKRIVGLGIADPFEVWTWHEEIGAPKSEIDAWRDVNVAEMIGALCPWPVHYANDITAAAAAELMFGKGADIGDFLYVYMGSFVGGGLVLDGHLFPGRTQNAAAIGSMPAVSRAGLRRGARVPQLVNLASIYVLERRLIEAGKDASFLWRTPDDWSTEPEATIEDWLADSAFALAHAVVAAIAVLDVQNVVIDGAFPRWLRLRLIDAMRSALTEVNLQGLSPFNLVEGTIGSAARAMGGAALPLLANFTQDREVLFNDR